jgi:hypothetical protein
MVRIRGCGSGSVLKCHRSKTLFLTIEKIQQRRSLLACGCRYYVASPEWCTLLNREWYIVDHAGWKQNPKRNFTLQKNRQNRKISRKFLSNSHWVITHLCNFRLNDFASKILHFSRICGARAEFLSIQDKTIVSGRRGEDCSWTVGWALPLRRFC